jgi:regulator of protease activity HflC (stomatin/prohibitin superfamily)
MRQRKYEQRDSLKEDFSREVTHTQRELEIVRASAQKSVAEIKAQAKAEQAHIQADAELQEQIIVGDTLVTKSKDETNGLMEAELVEVGAKNDANKKIASKMLEISDLKAQTVDIVANGES